MSGFTSLGKKGIGNGLGGGVAADGAVGPFGTLLTSNLTPSAQGTFVYDINDTQYTTGSCGSGSSVTNVRGLATVTSDNSSSGSAFLRLTRGLKYRPGQGAICRLTAMFGSGSNNTNQLAGVGNTECGYYFAKIGDSFGILHREKSDVDIRKFTITSPPAGAATIAVTLDGTTVSASINGGGTANQTAYQLSQADYSKVGPGWQSQSIDGTVYFVANQPGPHTGSFGMVNLGSSIASSSVVRSGSLPIETFISQSNWNIDTMDGEGPSKFSLDPSKGNIYNIGYQYLGFGNPTFSVEDSSTGAFAMCHQIHACNARITTVVSNPHMYAGWHVINSGSTTGASLSGASAATFTEGLVIRNVGPSFTSTSSKTSVGTAQIPALTLRANRVFKDQACFGELDLFNLSVGSDSGAAANIRLVIVNIYKNAALGGPVNFQNVDSRSIAAVDTAATSLTVTSKTQLLKTFIVPANSSIILNVTSENFFVASGETLTVGVQTFSNTVDAVVTSVSWFEDQ